MLVQPPTDITSYSGETMAAQHVDHRVRRTLAMLAVEVVSGSRVAFLYRLDDREVLARRDLRSRSEAQRNHACAVRLIPAIHDHRREPAVPAELDQREMEAGVGFGPAVEIIALQRR